MKKYLLFTIISLFTSFSACNYFESDNPTGISKIDLNIANLKPLADSLVYVGWITTSSDSSFKIFERNVDQSGIISLSTTNNFGGLHQAQQFRVTVEELPDSGSITSPGSNVILIGRFTLGTAKLRTGTGVEYSSSTGVYTITTPTDSFDNDLSGIWFINSTTSPGAGLNLPVLNENWFYEGLIIINNDTLSTGTFTDPAAADEFSGYSGSDPAFPFPGEDFLTNPVPPFTFPLDLSGARVLVTLDYDGTESLPSFLTVLFEANVPAGVQANTTHQLQKTDAQVPSGVVSITVDLVE